MTKNNAKLPSMQRVNILLFIIFADICAAVSMDFYGLQVSIIQMDIKLNL